MPEVSNERPSLTTAFRNRWVQFVLAIVGGAVALYLLGALAYKLRGVLIPLGLALAGAYVLNPVIDSLQARLRCNRTLLVVPVVLLLLAVVIGALAFGVYYTVVSVDRLAASAQTALQTPEHATGLLGKAEAALDRLPVEIRTEIEKAIQSLPDQVRQNFATISTSLLQAVGGLAWLLLRFVFGIFQFALFFVIAGYLLLDWPALQRRTLELIPRWHYEDIRRILRSIDRDLHAFFRGQLLDAIALGVIYTTGLVLFGVPFGLIIGVVAGVGSLVPYLGLTVGLGSALLVSLIPFTGLLHPVGALVSFAVGQMADTVFLTPRLIGRNVGLSPVVVILSILMFAQLFGFLGVLFAIPLASVTKVLLGEMLRHYRHHLGPGPTDARQGKSESE
jgi:predicted PurR-regulated permease PerM